MVDARSRHLHNEGARRANEVRQRRATVENPQWAMSRPAEWYQNRENLRSVKDTLANVKGNRDFLTTNQDESRNMYQMVMNNMYGGKGARMLDTRGLPEGARRTGRTLFQDPSKSQGFFGDVRSMAGDIIPGMTRRPNPAAVRATEWNPLHEEGHGRDWFIDEFGKPFSETLEGIMKFAPGIGMASRIFGGKEREPLPSDRSWIPEGLGEYEKVPMIDLEAMDRDINDGVGIAGVVDSDPEERAEYAAQTFGADRHPGTASIIEGPMEQSEVIYSPHRPTYYDRAEGLDFDEDPNQPYVAPDDYVEEDFGDFYTDENTLAPERGLPFDDTNREQAIANQYATNFIGPRDDPHRRPGMYDVAGPGINRGLIPYPEYNDNMVYTPQMGRGDLPRYGYDYAGERQAREEEYRLQQLLDSILNKEEEQVPPPFSIGASR